MATIKDKEIRQYANISAHGMAARYYIELRNLLFTRLKDMALSGATPDELQQELKNIEEQNPTGRL